MTEVNVQYKVSLFPIFFPYGIGGREELEKIQKARTTPVTRAFFVYVYTTTNYITIIFSNFLL